MQNLNKNAGKILIIGRNFNEQITEKRSLSSSIEKISKMGSVTSKAIKNNLNELVSNIGTAFEGLNDKLNSYKLDEINLKIEISATGQVAILGSGVSATGTGGIELKFKYSER